MAHTHNTLNTENRDVRANTVVLQQKQRGRNATHFLFTLFNLSRGKRYFIHSLRCLFDSNKIRQCDDEFFNFNVE